MSESNLIECTYGHHMADQDKDFTASGLNKAYFTICRKCKVEQTRKYRQKYRDEIREREREGNRIRKARERERKNCF